MDMLALVHGACRNPVERGAAMFMTASCIGPALVSGTH